MISDRALLRVVGSSFIQGELRANLSFERDAVRASDFALDIIENGYKILFQKSPLPYSIENRSSALLHRGFVLEVLLELLTRGCINQLSVYPLFCNPLDFAVELSGKLRLILDLFYLDVKYEDLRTFFKCLFSYLIFSQPIITLISARNTGNLVLFIAFF